MTPRIHSPNLVQTVSRWSIVAVAVSVFVCGIAWRNASLLGVGAAIMCFVLRRVWDNTSHETSNHSQHGGRRRENDRSVRVVNALAFIAHGETAGWINPLFGPVFGTIYDISTVAILWFAGASAMSALLNWAPRYLPRYGIQWAQSIGMLVLALTSINLLVTWVFDARVEAQAGVLTTAVLVLICNKCLAVAIVDWNRRTERPWYARFPWRYFAVMLIFIYMTIAVIIQEPEGLFMAAAFIALALVCSMISRRKVEPALR
jgi:hypothetical protein